LKRASVDTEQGRLQLVLANPSLLEPARELALRFGLERAPRAGATRFAGESAWLKSSALAGRARLRHGAARVLLRAPPPRVREAANLDWLAARLFQVPRPLAAGWFGGAMPRWQFLVTAFVEGEPLEHFLRGAGAEERAALLVELARETARMHALHFVHRDLHLRNVLVAPATLPRRLAFLDAWRGGERLQLRGPAYDLASLFLEAPSLLTPGEIRAWLAEYAAERAALGAPLDSARTFGAATAARRSLLARARREPGRWRIPEPPVQDFDFEAAAR
jgi:hypothetical protein